jgi:hypothetical protein
VRALSESPFAPAHAVAAIAGMDSLLTGKITGNLQNFGRFCPRFGNLHVNSPGDSKALRQIPCSVRNRELFSPEQGIDPAEQGIYRELPHRPFFPFATPNRSFFE